jgi:hypothetical protein
MAVTAFWYTKGLQKVVSGIGTGVPIVWTTDAGIKVSLHTVAYTPNQNTDEFWTTPAASEVPATGNYVARGQALAGKTQDAATANIVKLDANDTVWAASTIANARYAVIYKDSGTNGTSPLLGYVNFGQDESSSAAAFTITWSTDGILRVTAA